MSDTLWEWDIEAFASLGKYLEELEKEEEEHQQQERIRIITDQKGRCRPWIGPWFDWYEARTSSSKTM